MDSDKQIPKNENDCCPKSNSNISNEIPVKSIHIQILIILDMNLLDLHIYEDTTF